MCIRASVETLLCGDATALRIVGQIGSGKLFAVELAAKAAGFHATVLDRPQGGINYRRLGDRVLGGDGLTRAVTIVCGADSKNYAARSEELAEGCGAHTHR